jgi:hypothetical protein
MAEAVTPRRRRSWWLRAMYAVLLVTLLSVVLLLLQDVLSAVEYEGGEFITYLSSTWRGQYSWSLHSSA